MTTGATDHQPAPADSLRDAHCRLIVEHAGDLLCLLDAAEHFLYVSPSFATVLDQPAAELTGAACLPLVHPQDQALFHQLLSEAQFFRDQRRNVIRLQRRDDQWLTFEIAATAVPDGEGKAPRTALIARNVTERQRADSETQHLAAFPRSNPNPVLAFDADGALMYCNAAALDLAKSLHREHPRDVLPLNTATNVKICLASGQKSQRLDTIISGRTISWSFYPVQASQVVHCYAEDITARLNLEAQLRQSQKMESIGQLAAGVAHDFNNILTIIQGHSGLLLGDKDVPESLGESLKQMSHAAERAARLTRQLLLFSRKQLAQPQLIDLNDVITSVTKMLRVLLGESIVLQLDLAQQLPAIHADPSMMEQVVMNLTVNSRDAMPNGGKLVIRTSAREIKPAEGERHAEARPGHFVCLRVEDSGCGMDAVTLNRIFEPFFTTKEVGKGTGLGLATVYGVVQQHKGWVEVSSVVGLGTTFQVFLPVSSKSIQAGGMPADQPICGGNETILVVEDEAPLRELVLEILSRSGYQVIEAANGTEALAVWQKRKSEIDLLLTDMMMPGGISGRELAAQILADRPDLRVIYTSGYPVEVLGQDFTVTEGFNFLQKPYHPQTLAQAVRECLDARGVPPPS